MNQKEIIEKVFLSVFGKRANLGKDQIRKRFAFDIPLPEVRECDISGEKTWIFFAGKEKIASQKAVIEWAKKDKWMRKRTEIKSIDDILKIWQEINYITAEKQINSDQVFFSDGVYNSRGIYHSASIFSSKNILYGYKLNECEYVLACRDSANCSFCLRVNDSINCSNSFEVSWSYKISRSFFIHDCANLYECMFCSHIYSRRYCIANMQFEKHEYFKIKEMVIDWIFESIK